MTRRFEIIEARHWHCGEMARKLRREHREIIVSMGYDPHRALRDAFEASCYRKAWLVDGKLAGLGGVIGPSLSPVGVIWLALTEDALKFKNEVVKEAGRQIAYLLRIYRLLTASTLFEDARSARFASALGFIDKGNTADEVGRRCVLWTIRPETLTKGS